MDTLATLGLAAAADIVKQCFLRVFEDANTGTEAWFQRLRMRSSVRDRYADYILRTVGVFPLFATTKQASVEATYVRVAIAPEVDRFRYRPHELLVERVVREARGETDCERSAVSSELIDVLDESRRALALIGGPGSGKTTLLRHVAVVAAKGRTVRGRHVLPVFIAARDLISHRQTLEKEEQKRADHDKTKPKRRQAFRDVQDAVERLLESFGIEEVPSVVKHLLTNGDMLLLLDGVDEVDRAYQLQLLKEIRNLVAAFPSLPICVSSRPRSMEVELPEFDQWETLPLSLDERTAFVRKWFDAIDSAKGERLLQECATNPSLLDLGSNPLLLCIVCALYYNDLRIPDQPDELYGRVLDGLLGGWDAFRNVARDTILASFTVRRRLLLTASIAWSMFHRGLLVFSTSDVVDTGVVAQFVRRLRTEELAVDDVLKSLHNDFGVLVERAPGMFSFAHLTLQEFLTATYLTETRRELDYVPASSDQRWFEVLRLTARLLHDASAFMSALTSRTDLSSRHEVRLLLAAWAMHPVVEPGTALALMRSMVKTLENDVWPVAVTRQPDSIEVTLLAADHDERRRSAFRELPGLIELLRNTGFTMEQLQITPSDSLFVLLSEDVPLRLMEHVSSR